MRNSTMGESSLPKRQSAKKYGAGL
jgi:hypothetical protein